MNVVNVVPMRSIPRAPPSDPHAPVLTRELVSLVAPKKDGVYVDATLGAGGHAAALLAAAPGARVVGIDRDPGALVLARGRLAPFGERVRVLHGRFSELSSALAGAGLARVDGVIADLGVSSMQLDDAARGMSFRAAGPIDMRMDPTTGVTARALIDDLHDDALAELVARLGEERRARRVARCIKQAAARGELETTLDLRRAVVRAVGPARLGGIDPATRTFQALRMAVNDELGELAALCEAAAQVLVPGGVLAVLAFHSLEDRLVKRTFSDRARWQPLVRKPITASDAEVERNPRARSAKLRAARREAAS
jgi:16S rRNA (cytosine1402-N4)-methyltransferase